MAAVTTPQTAGTSGTVNAPAGWHPTVLYMVALVLLEIVAVGFLSRHLLK